MLRDEIFHYNPELLKRPSFIVANKLDLPEAKTNFNAFKEAVGETMPILPVSAKFGLNLLELLIQLRQLYDEKSLKVEEQVEERYDPVREKVERKSWRQPPATSSSTNET